MSLFSRFWLLLAAAVRLDGQDAEEVYGPAEPIRLLELLAFFAVVFTFGCLFAMGWTP